LKFSALTKRRTINNNSMTRKMRTMRKTRKTRKKKKKRRSSQHVQQAYIPTSTTT